MNRFRNLAFGLAPFALIVSTGAQAHPKIVAATPAANATVAKPARVELKFNEKLMAKLSGADLVMTGMPGMKDHAPMKMASTVTFGRDGRTMIVTPKTRLPAGSYRVEWRVVSADTHRVTGAHAFSVK